MKRRWVEDLVFWGLSAVADARSVLIDGLLPSSSSCRKRDGREAAFLFQSSLDEYLPSEVGLSRLADDLRTGALSVRESPHVYAVVGGGEWGPRLAAKALFEAMYIVDPWDHITVVDLEEASAIYHKAGLEEGQHWLKWRVASAIRDCPGNAAVILDNAHVLKGEDVLLLDPLLLLFDDNRSHMDEAQGKVSGEGSTFLLLLNDEPSQETNGLDGKGRLHQAWEYRGPAFTTEAFVGRVDAAMLISSSTQAPSRKHADVLQRWKRARRSRHSQWPPPWRQERKASTTRRLLRLVGATVVTLIAAGIATWRLWGYRDRKSQPRASCQDLPSRPTRDSSSAKGNKSHGEADTEQESEAGVGTRTRSKRKKEQARHPKEKEQARHPKEKEQARHPKEKERRQSDMPFHVAA